MGYDAKQVYAGKRLKAEDLKGRGGTRARVQDVLLSEVKDQESGALKKMLELTFVGTDKTFLLNVTNSDAMTNMYGSDTDAWIGQTIEITVQKTRFGNKTVDALRITDKSLSAPAPRAPAPQQQRAAIRSGGDPFSQGPQPVGNYINDPNQQADDDGPAWEDSDIPSDVDDDIPY